MAISESERNDFILECLSKGMSLSELQDQLVQQFDIHMTYMDLRMLTADLQVNWEKQDAKAMAARPKSAPEQKAPTAMPEDPAEDADGMQDELPEEPAAAAPQEPPAADATLRGPTTVEVSKVVRPGAALSGTVTFGSGASGEWYMDQYGRLGLSLAEGSPKPDQQDVKEFQAELEKQLGY